MNSPLRRRGIYSAATVAICLSAAYIVMVILPDPGKYFHALTANGMLIFMTAVGFVMYGGPAWAVLYLILTILDIPASRRAIQPPDQPPGN